LIFWSSKGTAGNGNCSHADGNCRNCHPPSTGRTCARA